MASRRFLSHRHAWPYGFMLLAGLAGCSTTQTVPNDPRYAPAIGVNTYPAPTAQGSIYAAGTGMNLWDDQRARRIGDIIMIKLDERTVSQKSTKSSFKKNDENDMSVSSLLGVTPELKLPGAFNADTPLGLGVSSKNDRNFQGESGADQSNRLLGDISVTVINVLPGGVLAVRGEKWITLTQGEEFIRIEGLIRQSDIAPDNTVESTRIADARITYSGTGELADANRRGWLTKVFSGPWWPF